MTYKDFLVSMIMIAIYIGPGLIAGLVIFMVRRNKKWTPTRTITISPAETLNVNLTDGRILTVSATGAVERVTT